ncbi:MULTISPECIES: preprotein translocase subunit YajC [unclassified Microbacterium]|uniref:preprotein translocase subunit YajC n=1 Tax=unclassified Microbacterium TaxID=2609290 RepID=UPI000F556CF7|nr:preprotein translocase subunit YajC [Microbacterium sp. ABRD28]AZC13928.1 preprotein translocase subunit YajC [Microbacterium sp. ABRD28]
MDFATFFANYGLILLLAALLVFMFWSSRRRLQKQKAEQEERARQTVPGAEVLLQGGLYGTIVSYDPDNLDQPAVVEIAPGVSIKVHSQAILRVVNPTDVLSEEEFIEAEVSKEEYLEGVATGDITSISDDRRAAAPAEPIDDSDTDKRTKPDA